jgi:hypothetical protein
VERYYDCVARCQRRDTKEEATLGYELGNWFSKAMKMNLPPDEIRKASQTSAANVTFESAVTMLAAVFFSSVTTSFLSALSSSLTGLARY